MGFLLFVVYINDLPRHINHFTNVVLFADDTSILITEKNYKNLNQKIRLTLDCNNGWCFKANQLVHNLMKTNIIKFSPLHLLQSQLISEHDNTTVSEVPDTKFLEVQIDNYLNLKCHIDRILLKLSTAGFVIRQNAVTSMRNEKAPGEDGITGEICNRTIEILTRHITAIYNGCLMHKLAEYRTESVGENFNK